VTVTLELPPQIESAYIAEAQARGLSLDAVVLEVVIAGHSRTVFEQGLGLFGSREDAALLDEAVSVADEERKRAGEAVADILELREGVALGGLRIRDLINEGRKY
jgi:hypothetical protein